MKPHGDRFAHFADSAKRVTPVATARPGRDTASASPSAFSLGYRPGSLHRRLLADPLSFFTRRTRVAAAAVSAMCLSGAAWIGAMTPVMALPSMTSGAATAATFAATFATLVALPSVASAQEAKTFRDETPDADSAIADQQWQSAIADLDKRIASNPRDVQARFKRATALARLGQDDEAIKAFIQITQTYPELPEPYNNLAALYAKHGRYQEARATLETALSANPNFALARRNLGDIYLRLAAASYQQAAKQDPDDKLAVAREKGIEAIITASPANSATLNRRNAPRVAPVRHTKAEPVNKHGFVPSMGNQPPTILPETDSGSASQN